MGGLYFEDFEVGKRWVTQTRTLGAVDVETFAILSGDRNAIHLGAEASPHFKKQVVHGLLGLCASTGLMYALGEWAGTTVVMGEIERWKMTKPIYVGDTVWAVVAVVEVDELEGVAWYGKVWLAVRLLAREGEVCQYGKVCMVAARRAAEAVAAR